MPAGLARLLILGQALAGPVLADDVWPPPPAGEAGAKAALLDCLRSNRPAFLAAFQAGEDSFHAALASHCVTEQAEVPMAYEVFYKFSQELVATTSK